MKDLKSYIRTIPDFPSEGIMFRDITTLLGNPAALKHTIDLLFGHFRNDRVQMVAGVEARGFVLAGALACRLGAGFVPIRKAGKLPHQTIEEKYQLEYGEAALEMHLDAFGAGDRVLLIDDLIATGGTAGAAMNLIDHLGGDVVGAGFVVELPGLGGADKLRARCDKVVSLVSFDGD
ncbi:adenine phosphoribosyltransferase [Kordiimonas lacus]|uniref:Adenine phosphoribosyltransferase n=1 Tax=Kordiimonas lacus TaxID=637679 RepID=A0A1G6ZUY2_9PROT|nr:adenine phosphoribosyltransferase [Kordiimonas lacus]SDE06594.1 adenine phosphoribosyltransferase [Kordiimonas lacus]